MTFAAETAPLLDDDYVGELATLFGAEFLRRQFAAFAAELRTVPGEIGDLLGRGDHAAAERAHALKGAALAVGAARLAAHLGELEREIFSPHRLARVVDCGRDTEAEIARLQTEQQQLEQLQS